MLNVVCCIECMSANVFILVFEASLDDRHNTRCVDFLEPPSEMPKAKNSVTSYNVIAVRSQTKAVLLRKNPIHFVQCNGDHAHGKLLRDIALGCRFSVGPSDRIYLFVLTAAQCSERLLRVRGRQFTSESLGNWSRPEPDMQRERILYYCLVCGCKCGAGLICPRLHKPHAQRKEPN